MQDRYEGSGAVSKAPDKSYLADAIHLMDLVHLVDEEVPAANAIVARSKTSAATAQIELEKHQRWLEGHQELYAEAVKGCQRRLKRQAFVRACKRIAFLPTQLLASMCVASGHAAWAYVRRFRSGRNSRTAFTQWISSAGHGCSRPALRQWTRHGCQLVQAL
jgi:hypothetical protein